MPVKSGSCRCCGRRTRRRDDVYCDLCQRYFYERKKRHAEQAREGNRRRKERLMAAGLCYRCGREPAVNGGLCDGCRQKLRERYMENLEERREEAINIYRRRIEAGVCAQCGKKPPAPGRRFCEACLEAKRNRHARKRELAKEGLCTTCGKRPAAHGKYCEECRARKTAWYQAHREEIAARDRERRQRKIEAGICPQCGKKPLAPGRKCCAECQEKRNRRVRENAKKKRGE